MAISVTMPRLGESVSEGTVTRWLKQEGDQVEADEPLLEVSTDKVDTEIPSPAAGVLKSIKVGEDETVEVGSELAVIDDGGGGSSDQAEPAKAEESTPAEPEPQKESAEQSEPQRAPEDGGDDEGESAASTGQREAVAADAEDDGAEQPAQDRQPAQAEPDQQPATQP